MSDGMMAALIVGAVLLLVMTATWFDWRRQERDRPQENFRGPAPVRYAKTLVGWLGHGLMTGL